MANLLDTLTQSLTQGLTVEVTTSLTPSLTLDLTGVASGPPSALAQWLKPQVRIYSNGTLLKEVAPYGAPSPPNYWLVAACVWGGIAALVFWRYNR